MATGQLMFEVGIKSAQEQLDKIKQEFTKANGDLQKLLNLKVSIDGVDAVTKALNQIGDTTALRNLRNEIAALNRESSLFFLRVLAVLVILQVVGLQPTSRGQVRVLNVIQVR